MYQKNQLENQLRIITHEMKARHSAALGFWTKVGGRYEQTKNKGAAHFLEHIVFKGTKNYQCAEIKEKIEGIGGALNAFTSEECTCYFAKVPGKKIEQTFDILSDMVLNPLIAEKDVNKERGVILEEIKMYYDLPQHLVCDLLDQLLWPNHPLGQNIAGTLESVGAMSYEDLRSFHQEFYIPSNMVVSACGAVTHNKIVSLTKKKFGKFFKKNSLFCAPAASGQNQARVNIKAKDIEQMHLALGVQALCRQDPHRYVLGVLNVILGGNMSSRLFNEVREKRGLAYSISSGVKLLSDTGAFIVRAGVDNAKIAEAVDVILKELKRMREESVTADELTRAKDYLIGQMALSLEDTADHMFWMGESLVATDKIETFQNVMKRVNSVTIADIRKLSKKIFCPNKLNLSLVGPLKSATQKKIKNILGIS